MGALLAIVVGHFSGNLFYIFIFFYIHIYLLFWGNILSVNSFTKVQRVASYFSKKVSEAIEGQRLPP